MTDRSVQLFAHAAAKRLSLVEISPSSNQHEVGGAVMRELRLAAGLAVPTQGSKERISTQVLALHDDAEPDVSDDVLTLYDARHRHETRTEWRAYYPADGGLRPLLRTMEPGDLAVYALTPAGQLVVLLAAQGSQSERLLLSVVPADLDGGDTQLTIVGEAELVLAQQRRASTLIADALGLLTPEVDEQSWLEAHHGLSVADIGMPTTLEMASLAWQRSPGSRGDTADERLVQWLEAETRLFYVLEEAEVTPRIERCDSVDEYLTVTKSILNRRRVRRGYSLEHHLSAVLRWRGVRHDVQVETEPGSVSDFIMPSELAYRDTDFPTAELAHLGAKSTARERWRQVLTEAARIDVKHLATVDARLSDPTRDDMARQGVVLVMPEALAAPYGDARILTVERFVEIRNRPWV